MTSKFDILLKSCDEVLRDAARPGHPMTKPDDREITLARGIKAVAEVLEEVYAEASRQLLTMQSDSAESRDALLWNERGLVVEDIRAAIEERLK